MKLDEALKPRPWTVKQIDHRGYRAPIPGDFAIKSPEGVCVGIAWGNLTRDPAAHARTMAAGEEALTLCVRLTAVISDLMRSTGGNFVVQDYRELNEAPLDAQRLLTRVKG